MHSLFTIVNFYILLRFQQRRRRKETTSHLIFPIRNILFEWEHRRSIPRDLSVPFRYFDYSKSLLSYIDLMICHKIKIHIDDNTQAIETRYELRNEPFDLYYYVPDEDLPPERQPASGIRYTGRRYHEIPSGTLNINETEHIISDDPDFIETPEFRSGILHDETIDLSGAPPVPEIVQIIHDWFPHYEQYINVFCRPPSFGPQAFRDFNRPTPNPPPPTPERHEAIMTVIRAKFNIKPYRPLHFVDAIAAETPLNTSASYYSKFDPQTRVLAHYSAPTRYRDMPTSKGYNFNVTMNLFRTEYHHIKYDCFPFPTDNHDLEANTSILDTWFAKHPSQLFIRTQISKRDPNDPKKIRPVYSVDDRFLHIEKTLVTPALAQLRNPQCCVAHGLETFRGAMCLLDRTALFYESFISLDWSQFDQRLPPYAITAFFLDYIPSLLIVSHGYFPSRGYESTQQDIHLFASKIYNIVVFLTTWYFNMSYLSFDGFAYIRDHGGVPSGLLNTQFLDSFGNMYIITDCLLEFGFTQAECLDMLYCVLGDDNLIFLRQRFQRVIQFMSFLSSYAEQRHGMVVSILKSVYTSLRTKITFLSYENNYGMPIRPIGKLVAQLTMPERPIPHGRQWIHSARALGLAYANCGQDANFHLLCKMVYDKFRPDVPVSSLHVAKVFKKWKYQLPEFDIESVTYTFPDFPTLFEIRQLVSNYHGFLSETDKWNFNLFEAPPSDNLHEYVTLKEYVQTNEYMSSTIRAFMQGKRSFL
ncbi:RNA-dependent RNA polymerase [Neurospora discreta partitivirus 1]|nr:RNA-dependent RNA polymerase [Neurospora discreta partitivirus 1]